MPVLPFVINAHIWGFWFVVTFLIAAIGGASFYQQQIAGVAHRHIIGPLQAASKSVAKSPLAVIGAELMAGLSYFPYLSHLVTMFPDVTPFVVLNRTGLDPLLKDDVVRRCQERREEQTAQHKSAYCQGATSSWDAYIEARYTWPVRLMRSAWWILFTGVVWHRWEYVSTGLRFVFHEVVGTWVYIACDIFTRSPLYRSPGTPFFMSNQPTFLGAVLFAFAAPVWLLLKSVFYFRNVTPDEVKQALAGQFGTDDTEPVNNDSVHAKRRANFEIEHTGRVGGAPPQDQLRENFFQYIEHANRQGFTLWKSIASSVAAVTALFSSVGALNNATREMFSAGFIAADNSTDKCIAWFGRKGKDTYDKGIKVVLWLVRNGKTSKVTSLIIEAFGETVPMSLPEAATCFWVWKTTDVAHIGEITEFSPFSDEATSIVAPNTNKTTVRDTAAEKAAEKAAAEINALRAENGQIMDRLNNIAQTMAVLTAAQAPAPAPQQQQVLQTAAPAPQPAGVSEPRDASPDAHQPTQNRTPGRASTTTTPKRQAVLNGVSSTPAARQPSAQRSGSTGTKVTPTAPNAAPPTGIVRSTSINRRPAATGPPQ